MKARTSTRTRLVRGAAATATAAVLAGGVVATSASADGSSDGGSTENAYTIPNYASATVAGMPQHYDSGQYANMPAVTGAMACDPGNPDGISPVAGRQWAYYSGDGSLGSRNANVTVTGWTSGAKALNAITTDGTQCTLQEGWRQVDSTRFSRTLTNGTEYAVVTRVNNVLVAVVAGDQGSPAANKRVALGEAAKVTGRVVLNYPPAA